MFSKSLVSPEHWILNLVSLKFSTKVFEVFIPFDLLNKTWVRTKFLQCGRKSSRSLNEFETDFLEPVNLVAVL